MIFGSLFEYNILTVSYNIKGSCGGAMSGRMNFRIVNAGGAS